MNCEIKESHLVLFSIMFLIILHIYINMNINKEGFASYFDSYYPRNYGYNYGYYYNWYYWLYYINPWYPPRRVDLPFADENGKTSWYSPYQGELYNY